MSVFSVLSNNVLHTKKGCAVCVLIAENWKKLRLIKTKMATVVQKVDSAIHRIMNLYPGGGNAIGHF